MPSLISTLETHAGIWIRPDEFGRERPDGTRYFLLVIAIAISVGAGLFWTPAFDQLFDWWVVFHPAGQQIFDVFKENDFFVNPPWLTIILFPFGLLPVRLSYILFCVLQVFILAFVNWRFAGNSLTFLLLITSSPFFSILANGQVDGLVLLGLLLSADDKNWYKQLSGQLIMLIKPQVLGLLIPYLWWQSKYRWQTLIGGVICAGLTFALWGNWIIDMQSALTRLAVHHNASLWPYGLLVGLPILVYALWSKDIKLIGIASFFCMPYALTHSLLGALFFIHSRFPIYVGLIVWLGLWVYSLHSYALALAS
ncbi:MAG: glycosyltransferase 87 family protein [Ardenticatenaceae bacterium]|nr:glycosyltransferase 87 family protein [Ardenticatenaceae bacterium]